MPKIKLPDGSYFYFKTYPLYLGIKQIDKIQAKENLLLFKKITDAVGLRFALAWGTALGAVREHDFIDHDEDIDVWIHHSQRDLLLSLLYTLKANGFEVARWDKRGFLSIIRKGEYIDISILYPDYRASNIMSCCGDPVPEKYVEEWTQILFLGEMFYIAKDWEDYMLFRYGKDWKIPQPYTNFEVSSLSKKYYYFKDFLKSHLPSVLYRLIYKKLDKKKLDRYYYRLDRYNNLKSSNSSH